MTDTVNMETITALMEAANNGNAPALCQLLDSGLDPNTPDAIGKPAISYAAMKGHSEIAALLLGAGAVPLVRLVDGSTRTRQPLHGAVQGGFVDVSKMLLHAGASVNAVDEEGNTALHLGAMEGHEAVCSVLLEAKADCTVLNDDGNSVLHCVTLASMISTLVSGGADPCAMNGDGITALHNASESDVIYALAREGASIEALDRWSQTALHHAAFEGRSGAVRALCELKCDVNAKDMYERTPLHLVSEEETALELLRCGGDASLCDGRGQSVEDVARGCEAEGVLRALKRRVDEQSDLMIASNDGNVSGVMRLLDIGVDPNGVDMTGKRAIAMAAKEGHVDVVSALLSAKAFPWTGEARTRQPLHGAVQGGFVDVSKMLLHAGASVNAVDEEGNTALHLGAMEGHEAVCSVLLEAKADTTLVSDEGYTASDMALQGGQSMVLCSVGGNSGDNSWAKCIQFPGTRCRHRVCQGLRSQYLPPPRRPKKKIAPPPPKFGPTCREDLLELSRQYCV